MRLGRLDQALADFNKALALKPNDPEAYYNRSVLWVQAKKPRTALADLNQALHLNPRYAPALFNRAGVHEDLGDLAAAQADMERFLTLMPDSPRGKARLEQIKVLRAGKQ